ncbi:serine/threonine-protein kinase PCRK1-like [Malania oleifera]|uniref:serine/threonine-protein kinase PCRK1-like n=1 Tax=Malania oleifera TaxID=397392 RepID=UPI0025AD9F67|nr:serine/threonine-protein kinase PCRK1-like [Malania oleifera]
MDCHFLLNNGEAFSRNGYQRISKDPNSIKAFAYEELLKATENFSPTFKLGNGEFGGIYRGVIPSANNKREKIYIVVKEFKGSWMQLDDVEMAMNIDFLGSFHHSNLVKLLGHSKKIHGRQTKRFLVYEYVINRSVQDALFDKSQAPLSWASRLKIAKDTAHGLVYLHEKVEPPFIFRCFKSSKVLLDEQMNTKLMDWGLTRLGPMYRGTHEPMAFQGEDDQWTVRYCDDIVGCAAPEFILSGAMTWQSNVWSYGVFLLELITGRPAFDEKKLKADKRRLLSSIRPQQLSNVDEVQRVMDPRLEGRYCLKAAHKLASLATVCLEEDPMIRPRMSTILEVIDKIVDTNTM